MNEKFAKILRIIFYLLVILVLLIAIPIVNNIINKKLGLPFHIGVANFIVVFLFGFIPVLIVYIFWLIFKRKLNILKFYKILIISLLIIVSMGLNYKASSNIIGYQLMTSYLEEVNDQRIKETGNGISLQEENMLKKEMSQNKEFQKIITGYSFNMSFAPSIFTIILMLFLFKKSKNIKSEEKKHG